MEIKIERIQGEMREGYYVQPMLKRLWAVQLDILNEIDAICRRHNIRYYGWFGTLLGAVRHRGFIPWDDDTDLAMLREDFDRFRYYAKMELPKEWHMAEEYPSWVSVFHTNTIRLDQEFLNKYHGCPLITGVDIFCLDRTPLNKSDEDIHLNLFNAVYSLCVNWDLPEEDMLWKDNNKWSFLKEIEELTSQNFDRQRPIKNQLYFLADRIAAMYWEDGSDEVTRVRRLSWDTRYRIPRSTFDKVIEIPFEHMMLPVPEDYDLVCRLEYGNDYMTPIKADSHDYLKDQMQLQRNCFKNMGEPFPECYEFTFD